MPVDFNINLMLINNYFIFQFSFRKVSFEGNGYVEMKPKHLKKNFKISFILQTSANNSLIMLFIDNNNINSEMLIRTYDGKIELHLPNNKIILKSEVIVTDKYYHIVELIKDGKSLTLKVDGNVQEAVNYNDEMRNAKIFIGGFPPQNGENLPKFSGEIKDIFINNE